MPNPTADPPATCQLAHRLFGPFEDPLFRAEPDSTPVMVVQLGEREAVLPLASLQREFGIADDSPDGRMLALIAGSVDFVAALQVGDTLPNEVLTGGASWEPSPVQLQIALYRFRLRLVDWMNGTSAANTPQRDARSLLQAANEPGIRKQIHDAIERAALVLALAPSAAVVALLDQLGQEFAYVEALRERLLRGLVAKVERLPSAWHGSGARTETLVQVRRLSTTALRRIGSCFDELDERTGDVLPALRDIEGQTAFIRSSRDWLYRTQRAWEPTLSDWDTAGSEIDERTLALLTRTYQFLAPRFMAVTEWVSVSRGRAAEMDRLQGMVW